MYDKIVNWYLSCKAVPYWYVLLTDCCIVLFSGVVAYFINHGLPSSGEVMGDLAIAVCAYLPCYVVGFRLLHTYSGIVRQTTVQDLSRCFTSLIIGVALIMLLRTIFHADSVLLPFRLRDLLMQTLLAIVLMCGLRITAKVFYDLYLKRSGKNGVYGLSSNALLDREMKYLLPREPINVDMRAIQAEMRDKCIMVTGGAGSIGSELAWLLATCKPRMLVLIDQAETPLHDVRLKMKREWPNVPCVTIVTSICHGHRMENIFKAYKPDIIFHAAAYKHVPMMEDNPVESVLNNVDGTRKLADLAVAHHVSKFVMVSTDKAVNPTNVMGCSKRICEIYCQSLAKDSSANYSNCQFITTRFGNVLGSNGSVIPLFREQIRRGGPVTVTHPDITRFFMLIPEACRLVLEAATIGHGGEIFVFDMGEPVRIVDLAKRMIQLSGRQDIEIKFTGLRPGEKIYEEVLNEKEKVMPTPNSKIKIAQVREYRFSEAKRQVDELITVARGYDGMATVRAMKSIVPEYDTKLLSEAQSQTVAQPQTAVNVNTPPVNGFTKMASMLTLAGLALAFSVTASAASFTPADTIKFVMKTGATDTMRFVAPEQEPIDTVQYSSRGIVTRTTNELYDVLPLSANLYRKDWFVYVNGGIHTFIGDNSGDAEFSGTLSPELSVGGGYWFNPNIALSLEFIRSQSRGYSEYITGHHGFGYGPVMIADDGTIYRKMKTSWWDVSIIAKFNLTRIINGYEGYNSKRHLNQLLLNAGIGVAHHLNYNQQYGTGEDLSGRFELQYSRFFNLKKRVSLDVKLRWLFYHTNFDYESKRRDRLIDRMDHNLGIHAGVTFYLGKLPGRKKLKQWIEDKPQDYSSYTPESAKLMGSVAYSTATATIDLSQSPVFLADSLSQQISDWEEFLALLEEQSAQTFSPLASGAIVPQVHIHLPSSHPYADEFALVVEAWMRDKACFRNAKIYTHKDSKSEIDDKEIKIDVQYLKQNEQ